MGVEWAQHGTSFLKATVTAVSWWPGQKSLEACCHLAVIWTERLHELGASQHLCPDVDSTLGLQHGSFRVPVLLSWQLRISKIHVLGRSLYLPINLIAAVIASLLLLSNINTALRLPRFKGGDYRSVGGVTEKLQKPSYITLLLPSVGSCKELVLDLLPFGLTFYPGSSFLLLCIHLLCSLLWSPWGL